MLAISLVRAAFAANVGQTNVVTSAALAGFFKFPQVDTDLTDEQTAAALLSTVVRDQARLALLPHFAELYKGLLSSLCHLFPCAPLCGTS